jgi:hypothetical protein
MAATLQHLSNGRLAVAIGKGIGRFLEKAGIAQHPAAVEEYIIVLRRLIGGEQTSFHGNHVHLEGMRIRVAAPAKPVPIYMAAIGLDTWRSALHVADGIETIWHDQTIPTHRAAMAECLLPASVLIPFSVSHDRFFENRAASVAELQHRISLLEEAGFDEAIIAYGDMADMEAAATLIGNR